MVKYDKQFADLSFPYREMSALRILRDCLTRRISFIVICTASGIAASVAAILFMPPQHEAVSLVAVSPVINGDASAGPDPARDSNRAEGEVAAITSAAFLAQVVERRELAGGSYFPALDPADPKAKQDIVAALSDGLRVHRVGASSTMELAYKAGDPAMAEGLLQGIVETYVDSRKEAVAARLLQSVTDITAATGVVTAEIAEAQTTLTRLLDELSDSASIDVAAALAEPGELDAGALLLATRFGVDAETLSQVRTVKRRLLILLRRQDTLTQTLEAAQNRALAPGANVRVIESAAGSAVEVRRSAALVLALGALLGIGAGVGGALLRDFYRGVLYTPDEMQADLDLPAWAVLPMLGVRSRRSLRRALQGGGRASPRGRRFLSAAGGLALIVESRKLRRKEGAATHMLVCSGGRADGKTFLAETLATILSGMDHKVLLVDLDFNRLVPQTRPLAAAAPGAAAEAKQNPAADLSAAIVHDAELGMARLGMDGLSAPFTSFNAAAFASAIDAATQRFDTILFDASGAPNELAIALDLTRADLCAVVVRLGASRRSDVDALLRRLRGVRGDLISLGLVFNAAPRI